MTAHGSIQVERSCCK